MKQYLIRLDDACPTMDKVRWGRMEEILDRYGIKPMVGIVPDCRDELLMIDEPDSEFWDKAQKWQAKGWAIALHGYDHCYVSDKGLGGLNPLWMRSEFAGVSLDKQREKIRKGVEILKNHGLNPKYFFAPSHTFDENTLTALKKESEIRIISDTIALKPYRKGDFLFLPQIVGNARKMPLLGIYTFCYHPNLMKECDFEKLERFLRENKAFMVSFDEISEGVSREKGWFDNLLTRFYFFYRRKRNLK